MQFQYRAGSNSVPATWKQSEEKESLIHLALSKMCEQKGKTPHLHETMHDIFSILAVQSDKRNYGSISLM